MEADNNFFEEQAWFSFDEKDVLHHYTSDKVVPPRIGWTVKEMTDTGKGNHARFGYSNFKYLPLGK